MEHEEKVMIKIQQTRSGEQVVMTGPVGASMGVEYPSADRVVHEISGVASPAVAEYAARKAVTNDLSPAMLRVIETKIERG